MWLGYTKNSFGFCFSSGILSYDSFPNRMGTKDCLKRPVVTNKLKNSNGKFEGINKRIEENDVITLVVDLIKGNLKYRINGKYEKVFLEEGTLKIPLKVGLTIPQFHGQIFALVNLQFRGNVM